MQIEAAKAAKRGKLTELDLPYPGSNCGYDPIDRIKGVMTSVLLSARHREHSAMLRTDAVVRQESPEVGYNRENTGLRQARSLMARILAVRLRKEGCKMESDRTRQMNLFKGMDTPDRYDYMAFVTNDIESALQIYAKYNQRGDFIRSFIHSD